MAVSSGSAWFAFRATQCERGEPLTHDTLRVDDSAEANEVEEGRIMANIERMEAVVQLASGPWPQHPWRAARAIENRLLRVQLASRDLGEDTVRQAVLASQAWSEALQTVASRPGASVEVQVSGADRGGHHDDPWMLYSVFSLGVVATIAGAYRVRGTVPGTVGQIARQRAEAVMAREKQQANVRIAQQISARHGSVTDGDAATKPRWPKQKKWQSAPWVSPCVPGEVSDVSAAPKPPTAELIDPLAAQCVVDPKPQPDDGPPCLLAKLDDLPPRGKRTVNVQEPIPLASWQRAVWTLPRVSDTTKLTRSVTVRKPHASGRSSLLVRLDALPARADCAVNIQQPAAVATAERAARSDAAGTQRQSKPRGGNHEFV